LHISILQKYSTMYKIYIHKYSLYLKRPQQRISRNSHSTLCTLSAMNNNQRLTAKIIEYEVNSMHVVGLWNNTVSYVVFYDKNGRREFLRLSMVCRSRRSSWLSSVWTLSAVYNTKQNDFSMHSHVNAYFKARNYFQYMLQYTALSHSHFDSMVIQGSEIENCYCKQTLTGRALL